MADLSDIHPGFVIVSWADPDQPSVACMTCGIFVRTEEGHVIVISTLREDGSEQGSTYIPEKSVLDISQVSLRLNG